MRFTTNKIQLLSIIVLGIILQSFSGCSSNDPEPVKVVKESIDIEFKHFYNGVPLVLNQTYKSPQQNDFWFTKKKYYLSNIVGVKSDGSKELISDVALIDISSPSIDNMVTGSIVTVSYTHLTLPTTPYV